MRLSITRKLGVAVLCLGFSGCSLPSPTVQTYDKDGVQFSYYSNWSVEKDALVNGDANVRSIQLGGPDQAILA
jgi:hypothetical protein